MSLQENIRECINEILSLDCEWDSKRQSIKDLINELLSENQEIEYEYIDNNIFFNTQAIKDKTIKKLLKCIRMIVSSLSYNENVLFERNKNRINRIVGTIGEEKDEANRIEPIIENTKAFIKDLQKCRILKRNRTITLLNDRGRKERYVQVFDYDYNLVSKLDNKYRSFNSLYKNWCLYEAYNSIYLIDRLLINQLFNISPTTIIESEEECWGALMISLSIMDKFVVLNYEIEEDRLALYRNLEWMMIKICYILFAVYLRFHNNKDILRTSECHINRARLTDRYSSDRLGGRHSTPSSGFAIGTFVPSVQCNPVLAKFLYIYDMQYASSCFPIDCDYIYGEEKYDYFASSLMMNTNQTVVAVVNDSFETPLNDILKIGEGISFEMIEKCNNLIGQLIFDIHSYKQTFESFVTLIFKYNRDFKSFRTDYELHETTKINNFKSLKSPLESIRCLSYSHQMESYTTFGKVFPSFIPIHFHIDTLIQNIRNQVGNVEIHEKNADDFDGYKYYLDGFSAHPYILPSIIPLTEDCHFYSVIILTDMEKHIIGISCKGFGFKYLSQTLNKTHLFYGIPVRVSLVENSRLPNEIFLTTLFQNLLVEKF